MPRLRSTLAPALLATVALAAAATPAVAADPSPAPKAAQAAPAPATPAPVEVRALAREIAAARETSTAAHPLNGLTTLVTRLLGLPGQGSVQTLLELLGVPADQAGDLARRISALATALTVPGGGDLTAAGR